MSRSPRTSTLALLLLLPACSPANPDATAARDAFAAFQQAALAEDRPALARLLTTESRPAADELDLTTLTSRHALLVEAVERRTSGSYHIRVRDPQASSPTATSTFVVVREAGAWRIDLVDTLLANHGVQPGEGFRIVPGGLDQARIDGIGAAEASANR